MTVEVKLSDIVRLRKAHRCGSYEWEVVRVGANIVLKCFKCHGRMPLKRYVLTRRAKESVSRGA